MAVEYLHCCDTYVDLDWNVDDVIYYEDEPYCYEHLLEHLMDKLDLTEEQADQYIEDNLI